MQVGIGKGGGLGRLRELLLSSDLAEIFLLSSLLLTSLYHLYPPGNLMPGSGGNTPWNAEMASNV